MVKNYKNYEYLLYERVELIKYRNSNCCDMLCINFINCKPLEDSKIAKTLHNYVWYEIAQSVMQAHNCKIIVRSYQLQIH